MDRHNSLDKCHNNLYTVFGEPEDESFRSDEVTISDNDIKFSMVNCAWCGSDDVDFEKEKRNGRQQ